MALNFSSDSHYVNCGSAASLDNPTALTCLAWFYNTNGDTQDNCFILTKFKTSPDSYYTFVLGRQGQASGRRMAMEMARATTGLRAESTQNQWSNNTWHFGAWVMDSAGANADQKLYIGSLTAIAAEVSGYQTQRVGAGTLRDESTASLYIGNWDGSTPWWQPAGILAFVGLWRRALTLGEIQAQQFRPRPTADCVLFMHLSNASTVPDLSGNANNGTVSGASVVDHVPLGPWFGVSVPILPLRLPSTAIMPPRIGSVATVPLPTLLYNSPVVPGFIASTSAVSNPAVYPREVTLDRNTVYQTWIAGQATDQFGQVYPEPALSPPYTGTPKMMPYYRSYRPGAMQAMAGHKVNSLRYEYHMYVQNATDYFQQYLDGTLIGDDLIPKWGEYDPAITDPNDWKWSSVDMMIDETLVPLRIALGAEHLVPRIELCYQDFRTQTRYPWDHPDEWAFVTVEIFKRMKAKGVPPDFWGINEPDNCKGSCTGTKVANGMVAISDALEAIGESIKFLVPSNIQSFSSLSAWNDIRIRLLAVKDATWITNHVAAISYHPYQDQWATQPLDSDLAAMKSQAATYSIGMAMTEFISADIRTLMRDLALGNVSLWQKYCATLSDLTPDSATYFTSNTTTNVTTPIGGTQGTAADAYSVLEVLKWLKAGAQRFAATSLDANGVQTVAWQYNGRVVVMLWCVNEGATCRVGPLPAGVYQTEYTTGTSFVAGTPQTVADSGYLLCTIPAAGVLTVYEVGLLAHRLAQTIWPRIRVGI